MIATGISDGPHQDYQRKNRSKVSRAGVSSLEGQGMNFTSGFMVVTGTNWGRGLPQTDWHKLTNWEVTGTNWGRGSASGWGTS